MKETEYRSLCRKLSVALQQPDVDALGEQGRIEIYGVEIALFFDEQANPDTLFCYVDMGAIPEMSRTEIYEQLLAMNLLSGSKTNGVYSLDPSSGNALFVVHFMNPDTLDAAQLAEAFQVYATQTNSLRAMLDEDSQSDPAAAPAQASGHGASMLNLA
nr:CesT family type III secretion system chaperone [uncultured Noviherbaspirillum sp.]